MAAQGGDEVPTGPTLFPVPSKITPGVTSGVSTTITLQNTEEPGVGMTLRQFNRYMERLDRCKEPLVGLWLAFAGVSAGVAGSAFVGLYALPISGLPAGTKGNLEIICGAGLLLACLCLVAYFALRSRQEDAIDQLKQDMNLLKTGEAAGSMPSGPPGVQRDATVPQAQPTNWSAVTGRLPEVSSQASANPGAMPSS